MRLIKMIFAISVVMGLVTSALVTAGITSGQPGFYVGAVWVSLILITAVMGGLLAGYKRVVHRLGTVNERLAELRFLLERRYELSRERLDSLLGILNGLADLGDNTQVQPGRDGQSVNKAELENLSARFQRSERRIIGRLEDEFLAHDRQNQQVAELLARLESEQK